MIKGQIMKDAKTVLMDAILTLIEYLTELSDVRNTPEDQFVYGEKTAYTECLEWLFHWDEAEILGLKFDVEKRFPL